jgi:osmotically-inducible protein OsmY
MFKLNFLLFLTLPFVLSSCMAAVFTAATGSTIAIAKDRSIGGTIDDAKIATSIKAGFIKNNFRELYTKISVDVIEGRVLYTGTVDQDEDMITAIQIAWDQKGVKEVINELKVDKKSNHFDLVQFTKDSMITTQVKSKIFTHRDIKFVNYTIITVDNIVYLFGIARSEEELEKVGDIASKINGVEKVVSHVKIKEKEESEMRHPESM